MDLLQSLKPKSKRLIVRRPTPLIRAGTQRTKGGVYIPDQSAARRRMYGQITRVLKVATDVDPEIRPNSRVLVGEFAGIPIHDGETESDYWVIGEGDVLALIVSSTSTTTTPKPAKKCGKFKVGPSR